MYILFNLLIFLLPFGVLLRLSIAQNIYLYPIDIVVGIILLLSIFKFVFKKEKIINLEIFKLFILFIIIGFVALLIDLPYLNTFTFFVSLAYSLRFIAYFNLLFAAQFLNIEQIKSIRRSMVISSVFFVFFGFIQFFFYKDLKGITYLGWDDHLYRLVSTFLDPNFAGAFLVLIFLLIVGKIIELKNMKNYSFWNLPIQVLYASLILIAIVLTYSRSAILMLLVGLSVLLVFNKMVKQLIVGVITIGVLVFLFANFKIEGLNPLRTASSEARLKTVNGALLIISANPVIGVGFNSYRYAQVRYGTRNSLGISLSNADSGTDNSFLFVLATTGMIGLAIFLRLLYEIGISLLNKIKSKKNKYNIFPSIVFSSLIALLVDSMFINSFFYIFILTWIVILIGTTLNIYKTD